MRTSDQTNEISAALSKAQGEMEAAPHNSINPHFKSHYANLAACVQAARPALAKHGLCVVQSIEFNSEAKIVGVVTRISHQSGQFFESDTWCQPRSLLPQDVGGCATYLKRYSFSAMVGLITEEDDDANASTGPRQTAQPAIKAANPHPNAPISAQEPDEPIAVSKTTGTISEAQVKRMYAMMKKGGWTPQEVDGYIERAFGFKNKMMLNRKQYDHICGLLENQVPFADAWDHLLERLGQVAQTN